MQILMLLALHQSGNKEIWMKASEFTLTSIDLLTLPFSRKCIR